jgi:hypothetical protein
VIPVSAVRKPIKTGASRRKGATLSPHSSKIIILHCGQAYHFDAAAGNPQRIGGRERNDSMNAKKEKPWVWVGLLPVGVLVANLFALGLLYAYTHLNLRPFLPVHDTVKILGQPMVVFIAFLFLLPAAASLIFLWPVFLWPGRASRMRTFHRRSYRERQMLRLLLVFLRRPLGHWLAS